MHKRLANGVELLSPKLDLSYLVSGRGAGGFGRTMQPALKMPGIAATRMARLFANTTTRSPTLHPSASKCIANLVLKRSSEA
jgi:hypothetical protein